MRTAGAIIVVFLAALFLQAPAHAGLIVNEVMSNEPGNSTSLEWIELYNNDPSAQVYLVLYEIFDGRVPHRLSGVAEPLEHIVLCRKLYSDESSPGFEEVWGNNSGVWGDDPREDFPEPTVIPITLPNPSGTVTLRDNNLQIVSFLTWNESGADGVSWERAALDGNDFGQCVDLEGSTPGFVNSLTPVEDDLWLKEASPSSSQGVTTLTFTVVNMGYTEMPSSELTVFFNDETKPEQYGRTITYIDIPALPPGDSTKVGKDIALDGLYLQLGARLEDDGRSRNNLVEFVAPGREFPPFVLSEVMANPQAQLETEWVEVRNRLETAFDISGWQLGDSLVLGAISPGVMPVEPGDYPVLAKDTGLFLFYYTGFAGRFLQPEQWPALNNAGDIVRLVDPYGIEADRFAYSKTYDDNYTWGRSEESGSLDRWGRSETPGGSPGEANRVMLQEEGSGTQVTVEPQVFSPNGDGFEETAVITVAVPVANDYTMKIFDRQGRVVRTFIENEQYVNSSYEWDGRSDSGKRMPVGIYILYFESSGVESVKKTVVIAR
jgi:gliding motility-associated-like protein